MFKKLTAEYGEKFNKLKKEMTQNFKETFDEEKKEKAVEQEQKEASDGATDEDYYDEDEEEEQEQELESEDQGVDDQQVQQNQQQQQATVTQQKSTKFDITNMSQYSQEDLQKVILRYDQVHKDNRATIVRQNNSIEEQ